MHIRLSGGVYIIRPKVAKAVINPRFSYGIIKEQKGLSKKTIRSVAAFAAAIILIAALAFAAKTSGAYAIAVNGKSKKLLPVYSVERSDNKISISFDCAWGVEHTDEILDALDKFGVKCTFFAVQFWIEKYPDYAKKIIGRGHEIGTHSKTHPKMSGLKSEEITAELTSSKEAIEKVTEQTVTLFRPPFGDYNDKVISASNSLGLTPVQWDVDSLDWKDLSADKIAARVLKRVKSGSIILCHNNGLHTAESLPLIFAPLISQGYEFVKISDLIYKDNYEILPDGRQKPLDSAKT